MKKQFKKLLSILMVFCMVMGMLPVQAFATMVPTVTLDQEELTLEFGKTATLNATIDLAEKYEPSWGSSDESIATVDSNGVVTAVGIGEAVITVTASRRSDVMEAIEFPVETCVVTVVPAEIDSVTVDIKEPEKGASPEFAVTLPGNAPYELLPEPATAVSGIINGIKWVDGETLAPMTESSKFEAGKDYNVTVYLRAKAGYKFKRNGDYPDVNTVLNGESDVTNDMVPGHIAGENDVIQVKMFFELPAPTTHTVTFDSDGGSAVEAQTINEGNKATKPADPTKEGYTFKGWFNGENEYDFDTAVTAPITLKAKWEENAPAPTLYNVWVAGTQVTSANAADILGDGAASYNPTTNTLTVNKNITATDAIAIKASTTENFNVAFANNATISASNAMGIYSEISSLNITGKEISVSASSVAIQGYNDVTISCDKLTVESTNSGGINAANGIATINGSENSVIVINALNGDAIQGYNGIAIAGGKLDITGKIGIYTSGTINLTVKEISIDTNSISIYAKENITIECDKLSVETTVSGGINSGTADIAVNSKEITIISPSGDAVQAAGDIDITGDKLNIAGRYGIYTSSGAVDLNVKEISIESTSVAISARNDSTIDCDKLSVETVEYGAISIAPGKLTINGSENSELTIVSPKGDAVQGYAGVTIRGGKLDITANYGIYTANGTLELTVKEISVESEHSAIFGNESVTIDCDSATVVAGTIGLNTAGSIIIKNGVFDIQSTDTTASDAYNSALYFEDAFTYPTGATVTGAPIVNGEFEPYDAAKNATYDHVKITVPAPVQPTVALDESAITLTVGETATLVPTITPADFVCGIEWSTSDSTVATVDSDGEVTALAAGTAIIKVTLNPNNVPRSTETTAYPTATCVVTVVPQDVPQEPTTSVTVTKVWDAPEGTVLPESVEVYLLANGQEVTDSRTILDAGNEWTYTWTELPVATEDGTPIVYTVDEVKVEGYEKTIGEAVETDTGIEIAITNTKDSGEDEEGGNGGGTTPTTPSAPSTPSVPDTSDNTNTLMYLAAMVASAAALVFVLKKKRDIE